MLLEVYGGAEERKGTELCEKSQKFLKRVKRESQSIQILKYFRDAVEERALLRVPTSVHLLWVCAPALGVREPVLVYVSFHVDTNAIGPRTYSWLTRSSAQEC